MIAFTVNDQPVAIDLEPETPLLWALRDALGLTGTKFGCGVAACGACTVLLDGEATRSCQTQLGDVEGLAVTTIEGLAPEATAGATDAALHPVQEAWIEHQVPQCGYCQSGMILSVVALLNEIPDPTDDDIDAIIDNICRCGAYARIRPAIHTAARKLREV